MSDSERHIVRPYGLIGGRYAVDDSGRRKYWLAWAIMAAALGVAVFSNAIGVPLWLAVVILLAGTVGASVLSADVARKGRKL